jgi:hypothetical protein
MRFAYKQHAELLAWSFSDDKKLDQGNAASALPYAAECVMSELLIFVARSPAKLARHVPVGPLSTILLIRNRIHELLWRGKTPCDIASEVCRGSVRPGSSP